MKIFKLVALVLLLTIAANARDQIKIVGSSTVYPFASLIAEEFGETTRYKTPVVESTGTGGGMKLFCTGNNMDTPDISNASRRIKEKEFDICSRNGVNDLVEIMFGYDGIVFAQSNENEQINITKHELFLAVAAKVPNKDNSGLIDNPYTHWNQINPKLPNHKITVYGPPLSSGTRDAFEEMVMEYPTLEMKVYRDAGYKGYRIVRTDGVYIPSGENDNIIVQKLTKDTTAFGIFGYSFLIENEDALHPALIDGIEPIADNISNGTYPISRSLFFYVKASHADKLEAVDKYVNMFTDELMIGEEGILTEIGLIPLVKEKRDATRAAWRERKILKSSHLDKH